MEAAHSILIVTSTSVLPLQVGLHNVQALSSTSRQLHSSTFCRLTRCLPETQTFAGVELDLKPTLPSMLKLVLI